MDVVFHYVTQVHCFKESYSAESVKGDCSLCLFKDTAAFSFLKRPPHCSFHLGERLLCKQFTSKLFAFSL